MTPNDLLAILARDEDSQHQFKSNITNEHSLATEMVAFANAMGGVIIIGANDDGTISGLTRSDISRLNNLVSNSASNHVRPPINPITENIQLSEGLVMVVHIPEGFSKPYSDKDGVIWVKSGADKRKATSREEVQRMYQSAGLLHGDEAPVPNMNLDDLDMQVFGRFYEKEYEEPLEDSSLSLEQLLKNLNLAKASTLNMAGALLFGKNLAHKLPGFVVKCVSYPNTEVDIGHYLDSQDISGSLKNVFDDTMGFLLRHLKRVQGNQNVNSLGVPEIPKVVLEELLANALIHRDFFISAPIRIFVFTDRIEIISPGHLPNHLSIENIKNGNSNIRNPIFASFATKILPYRGLGNGIRRALKAYSRIEFIDDRDGCLFKAIIRFGDQSEGMGAQSNTEKAQSNPKKAQSNDNGAQSDNIGAQSDSLLRALMSGPLSSHDLALKIEHESKSGSFKRSLKDYLSKGLIEYTLPEKPNSRLQQYRLTEKGASRLKQEGR